MNFPFYLCNVRGQVLQDDILKMHNAWSGSVLGGLEGRQFKCPGMPSLVRTSVVSVSVKSFLPGGISRVCPSVDFMPEWPLDGFSH
jgi:hypothetical protein